MVNVLVDLSDIESPIFLIVVRVWIFGNIVIDVEYLPHRLFESFSWIDDRGLHIKGEVTVTNAFMSFFSIFCPNEWLIAFINAPRVVKVSSFVFIHVLFQDQVVLIF